MFDIKLSSLKFINKSSRYLLFLPLFMTFSALAEVPSGNLQELTTPKFIKPSAQQIEQIKSALTYKGSDEQIKEMLNESSSVIQEFLEAASCQFHVGIHSEVNLKGVGKITASKIYSFKYWADEPSSGNFARLQLFNNHPINKCLDVERIGGYKTIDPSSFQFKVTFASDVSKDTTVMWMGMIKEDGDWLVFLFRTEPFVPKQLH